MKKKRLLWFPTSVPQNPPKRVVTCSEKIQTFSLNCLNLCGVQKVSTYSGSSLKSEPDFSTVKKKKKKKPPPSLACTSLSDKDLSFMINLGRFKYLLSQGFQLGDGSQIQSKSCHQLTSGQCGANFLILAK